MNFASAEVMLWNNVIIDRTDDTTTQHAYYQLDDTTSRGFYDMTTGVPVVIYSHTEALPYALTSGNVDWCNLTIKQYSNIYGTTFAWGQGFTQYDLLNTTTTEESYYFDGATNTSVITKLLRARDSLIIDMKCHYTDEDYLYEDNALIGQFTTYISSYECDKCSQTFEEATNEYDTSDQTTADQEAMYDKIQTGIGWNYTIWLYLSWVVKIGLIAVAVSLIVSGAYYFYKFFMSIGDNI